jgi:hypothetical protein
MLARLTMVAALLLAPTANADTLWKCKGPKGEISVQSFACPAGSAVVWRRDYTPDYRPQTQPIYSRPPPQANANTFTGPTRQQLAKEQCDAARSYERRQREVNPELTYDQLTALHDQTYRACKRPE